MRIYRSLLLCAWLMPCFPIFSQGEPPATPEKNAPAVTKPANRQQPLTPTIPAVTKPATDNQQQPATPTIPQLPARAADLLRFWFGSLEGPADFPEDQLSLWLSNSQQEDRQLRDFTQDVDNARRGTYNSWRLTPRGRLALILLLDQFPRHLYRNNPKEFAADPIARALVMEGIQRGDDRQLYPIERAFFYLPLEHSEDRRLQNLSVSSYRQLYLDVPDDLKPQMENFLNYALLHQQQINRFGRFPTRNAILRRESTPDETAYLNQFRKGF